MIDFHRSQVRFRCSEKISVRAKRAAGVIVVSVFCQHFFPRTILAQCKATCSWISTVYRRRMCATKCLIKNGYSLVLRLFPRNLLRNTISNSSSHGCKLNLCLFFVHVLANITLARWLVSLIVKGGKVEGKSIEGHALTDSYLSCGSLWWITSSRCWWLRKTKYSAIFFHVLGMHVFRVNTCVSSNTCKILCTSNKLIYEILLEGNFRQVDISFTGTRIAKLEGSDQTFWRGMENPNRWKMKEQIFTEFPVCCW